MNIVSALTTSRHSWWSRIGVAGGSMTLALLLTHLLWPFFHYTPFFPGFAAVFFSSWMRGRYAGFLAVIIGVAGYTWFPPPLPDGGFYRLLLGFVMVSGAFGWLVARRYEIEADLRASQEHVQTIIDAEPACVKVVSLDGRLLEMNRAGLAMLAASDPSQVIGRPVTDLVHPDDRSRYLQMHAAAGSGSPRRWEYRMVTLGGKERWVDSHIVPFDTTLAGIGTERAVLGVTSDITERKQLERQLQGAQHMEAGGRLAGGVAHDFNNLLTAISGFTELVVLTMEDGEPRRENLLEVQKAALRAEVLTRQLLAYSRRQVLLTTVLDVNALVGDIEKLLVRTIGEDVELVLDFDPALEPVRADGTQLEQVLINLAVNARDAMPNGGELRFATAMVDIDEAAAQRRAPMAEGRYVRVTITDTGSGISEDVRQHIFEPFFTTKELNT